MLTTGRVGPRYRGSMWPTLYTQSTPYGDVPYNTWGLMIMLAFFLSAVVVYRRSPRVGIDPDVMSGMVMLSLVAGLVGARLLHFIGSKDSADFFRDPSVFFNLKRGGFAFYGGLILAGTLGVVYARMRKVDPWKFSDVCGPAVMVGLSVGRLGCFFAGCCHGAKVGVPEGASALLPESFSGGQLYLLTSPPFLVQLTHKGVGLNDVGTYPTQLWEALAAVVIFWIGSVVFARRRFDGQAIGVVLLLYSLWRPINESLRGDEVRGAHAGLTTSQWVSVFVFVVSIVLLVIGHRRGLRPETPWVPPAEDDESLGSAPRL
jgi:phosphatidylglycerol:prolipoprotein diacylglycerol transferase